VFFSKEFGINRSEDYDWFDPRLDDDTKLFIDPFLVFESDIPHFRNASDKFIEFFRAAFALAARTNGLKIGNDYEKLKNILTFPEVPEVCLGYSKGGTAGSGAGGGFSEIFADAILTSYSLGRTTLRHFEEVHIFTTGIGHDRVSDVVANILKLEFAAYTQEICNELGVPTQNCKLKNAELCSRFKIWESRFSRLPRNPYHLDKQGILLVPKSFLRESIAIGVDSFSDYISVYKAETFRTNLNFFLSDELRKKNKDETELNSKQIKELLSKKSEAKKLIEQRPDLIDEFIDYIDSEAKVEPYDLERDKLGRYQPYIKLSDRISEKTAEFTSSKPVRFYVRTLPDFLNSVELIVEQYRSFVEDYNGWNLLWSEERVISKKEREEVSGDEEEVNSSEEEPLAENSTSNTNTLGGQSKPCLLEKGEGNKEIPEPSKHPVSKLKGSEVEKLRNPRKESTAQVIFTEIVKQYCQFNQISLSRSSGLGRGSVQFKFPCYEATAVLEVRVASNDKLEREFEKQVSRLIEATQIACVFCLIIVYREEDFKKVRKVRSISATLASKYNIYIKVFHIDAFLQNSLQPQMQSDGIGTDKQRYNDLLDLLKLALSRQINIEVKTMNDQPKSVNYNFNNAKFGGGFAAEGAIQVGGTLNDFSQNIHQQNDEIMGLLQSLRETAQGFPEAKREEAMVHLEDLQEDIQQPEKCKPNRVRTRLSALLGIALTIGGAVATTTDFANNVFELSKKLGVSIEVVQPHSSQNNSHLDVKATPTDKP